MSEIKLEPYDIRKLWEHPISRSDGGYKRRNFREVLEDFVNSQHDCCKIYSGDDYAKANIMAVRERNDQTKISKNRCRRICNFSVMGVHDHFWKVLSYGYGSNY